MKQLAKMAAVVASGLFLVACGGYDQAIDAADATGALEVAGTVQLRFVPDEFVVPAGEVVMVELSSEGVEHDFNIEDASDVDDAHGDDGHGDEAHGSGEETVPSSDLHIVHADAGTTETGSFTIDEPGTYTVYCSVPGHRETGMEATLEVVSTSG